MLRIVKEDILLRTGSTSRRVDLPLAIEPCDAQEHGTVVKLSLNTNFILPQAEKLRELLRWSTAASGISCCSSTASNWHMRTSRANIFVTVQLPMAGRSRLTSR